MNNYTHYTTTQENGEHWLRPVNPIGDKRPDWDVTYDEDDMYTAVAQSRWDEFEKELGTTRYHLENPELLKGRKVLSVGEVEIKWQIFSPTVGWVDKKYVTDLTKYIREKRTVCEIIKPKKDKPDFALEYDMGYYGFTDLSKEPLQAADGYESLPTTRDGWADRYANFYCVQGTMQLKDAKISYKEGWDMCLTSLTTLIEKRVKELDDEHQLGARDNGREIAILKQLLKEGK